MIFELSAPNLPLIRFYLISQNFFVGLCYQLLTVEVLITSWSFKINMYLQMNGQIGSNQNPQTQSHVQGQQPYKCKQDQVKV